MSEIETIPEQKAADTLAGAWPVEHHMSPLALFDPNRSVICAQYQLALIDDSSNEARAHVAAARKHLQAALNSQGISTHRDGNRTGVWLRNLCADLDRICHRWD